MATPQQIIPFFFAQLNNDARARTIAAGASWAQLNLDFYYSDEISVDIAVKATMLRILEMEHARLPDFLWINLGGAVNRTTKVSDAINVMAQVSSGAQHQVN